MALIFCQFWEQADYKCLIAKADKIAFFYISAIQNRERESIWIWNGGEIFRQSLSGVRYHWTRL
jgi:hypothetical protein